MSINPTHLRLDVIRPALQFIDLWTPAAEEIDLGTAAAESRLIHLRQLGNGPALGLWQMEPATHDDIWQNFLAFRKPLAAKMDALLSRNAGREADQMIWNLQYGAAMCRLQYYRSPDPLPAAGDIAGAAAMWKKVYNTAKGKGHPVDYVTAWRDVAQVRVAA